VPETLRVQAVKNTKRFCRRCLRWHPKARADVRNEIFLVNERAVNMDYVLCTACYQLADHTRWYDKRARARAALGYNESAILRNFAGEIIGS
jgi:hypothetical protein